MPDFGRSTGDGFAGDDQSLDAIRRSDEFIEALAGGRQVDPQDHADAALAALLGGWRDEMRWPPASGLISEPQAITALNAGLSEKTSVLRRDGKWDNRVDPNARVGSQRSRRGLSAVGAAAAAVLCIGGFGAVVAGAGPGDALYGLRTMLFGAPKEVRDDSVALAARTELQQVQDMIARGDWEQAQDKLVAVSSQVESIGNVEQKQELLDQFNDLSAKVVERDPEATAPPGIVYTVPPSAAELVPAVAPPTSVPSSPSATDATTSGAPESSAAATTTPENGPSTSAVPSETGSSAPASPSTSAAAPASPSTSAATSASPSTPAAAPASPSASSAPSSAASGSAAQQSQQPTTPTSAAPTTAATQATTTAVAPVTTAAPAQATAPQTTVAPTQVAEPTAGEASPAPQPITTTVVIPSPTPAG